MNVAQSESDRKQVVAGELFIGQLSVNHIN